MDDHVGLPFVFVVASAKNLNECENDPHEEENEAMCEVNRHLCFYILTLCSELSDVRLKIVVSQVLHLRNNYYN